MSDISTVWNPGAMMADWVIDGPDLAAGGDLETAVIISLFTDRRADPDDTIRDGTANPRGWWADAGAAVPIGSKLWLLEREKATDQVRLRAHDYAAEALKWLVDDGVAASVDVVATWVKPNSLALSVTLTEPDGRQTIFNYQWAWEGVS